MFETLSEMWGLRTFMGTFLPKYSKYRTKKSTTVLAALAAVFPEVRGQGAERVVVGAVVVERPFPPRTEDAGVDEPLQVVAQRRRWQVDVLLDFTSRRAIHAGLDHEAQHGEPHGMTERGELVSVAVEPG